MKLLAAVLVIAGLVLAIVPQFTNCEANGGTMPGTTMSAGAGMSAAAKAAPASPVAKMKCLWTARGGIVVGVALVALGALLFLSRRKETRRVVGIMSALMGLFAILLPLSLIGTCATDTAVCNTTMSPIMLSAGGIALAVGLITLVFNELQRDELTPIAAAS